jgi:hypothetical protein
VTRQLQRLLHRFMERLEDTTAVLFGLANGMSATLYCSLVTAVSSRFAVFGTKGCAELWTPEFQFRFSPTPEGPRTARHTEDPRRGHRLVTCSSLQWCLFGMWGFLPWRPKNQTIALACPAIRGKTFS